MADTVIVFGVTRAREEMRPRDIRQMFGRAGRKHGEESHAYLLIPRDSADRWEQLLEDPASYEVKSSLSQPDTFLFHFVSQVAAGMVTDETTFKTWYSRTLDKIQKERRGIKLLEFAESAQELDDTGCAEYDPKTNKIKIKPLGRVCSRYYFSPHDVRDWFINTARLVEKGLLESDTCQEWLLANITTAMSWEPEDVRKCCQTYQETITDHGLFLRPNTAVRFLSVHHALSGTRPNCELPELAAVRNDLPRMMSALGAICRCATKFWGDVSWFVDKLHLRLKYGVNTCLTDLVKLPGIGKSTARELYDKFEISNEAELRQKRDDVTTRGSPALKRAVTKALSEDTVLATTGDAS
jgi:replicative superfamily II helicase